MSVPHVLLGLLEGGPQHGYSLKSAFDARFGRDKPLRYGQVYATLQRLQRDGLAEEVTIEPGAGPDRRRYAVTPDGVQELEQWLATPEVPTGYTSSVLFAKTVLAAASGRSAEQVLDAQRQAHVQRMRDLLRSKRDGDEAHRLAVEFEVAHLEADLKWIERVAGRLPALAAAVRPGGSTS